MVVEWVEAECAICLSEMADGGECVRVLPTCWHCFGGTYGECVLPRAVAGGRSLAHQPTRSLLPPLLPCLQLMLTATFGLCL
uniref:RING-type domain-containing protein n=1 Tax=Oryza brachyantha TaxID=4533 RepID=J3LS91_ORYBR